MHDISKTLSARAGGLTTVARHGAHNIAARARAGLWKRFEDEVDPDRVLDPVERYERANIARRAYMLRLSKKSREVRARRKAAKGLQTPETTPAT